MTDETTTVAAQTPAPEIKETQETTAPAPEVAETTAEPAPAETTEAPATPEESPGDDPAEESKPKKKGGFQKRIEELTTERYKEKLRADDAERKLAELTKPKSPEDPTEEPKLDGGKYATVEDWQKAHKEWARSEGYKQAQQEAQQKTEQEKTLTVRAALAAREDVSRAKYPDFDQVISPVAPVIMNNPVMKQFVLDSETGTDVAYNLAKNPAKLVEISQMSPLAAVRELIKLEARLSVPPPKTITKAPEPIKPVGQSEKAPFDPEKASMEEYAKWRTAQERKRKG